MSQPTLNFSRHSEAAARLYLQHWMILDQLSSLLDPSIPLEGSLKIVDIACGTGIWLLDLAKHLPPTAELHGFDISSAHFPTPRELPANVVLDTWDALGPVPEHLHGQYDLVHCRGMMLYIQGGDPSRLLANLALLLKPRGWLQWEELDVVNMYMRGDDTATKYPNCAKYLEYGKRWLENVGIRGGWVSQMGAFMSQHNMEVVKERRQVITPGMEKPWTTMQVMATRDFIENDIIPTCGAVGEGGISPEEWSEILREFPRECQEGARVLLDIVYVVAKKG
ncbi:class I SAM-dependent methyltransferase [Aspergillus saccharolyticus JOP 1030-1]|uniref:S-adenosyl-L-methionine-dependent methyltransferase n=1 Tax=Aspergillus saccharolyticus JOP 1030-1 TaxID=1450539 RepID=A0A318ZAH2_9EURO|nr:S-adenosyl-L-methionine-dependent methyltransferase [Aspergillus saccharolyticus JOP 1030-1]PYH44435.1 S-adenosyl-L-methionine-dependent methyltransferase [Aspergillus saccharolyticus JOP 1030-1]